MLIQRILLTIMILHFKQIKEDTIHEIQAIPRTYTGGFNCCLPDNAYTVPVLAKEILRKTHQYLHRPKKRAVKMKQVPELPLTPHLPDLQLAVLHPAAQQLPLQTEIPTIVLSAGEGQTTLNILSEKKNFNCSG